ncbi:hypothetical protein ACFRMQ_21385 [Kitasatospora sp. NPDC056783]|uniref:hypothetical protein n=1 Tax=Kitasatospora sp. NPDC056783 TaxID=3345943 RepID=UPI00368E6AF3
MNSTTLISIAGILGTLLAPVVSGVLAARTARTAGTREDRAEARQARRHAYGALATALVVCMGTLRERMEALINTSYDPDDSRHIGRARDLAEPLESQLQAVTDALGAVLIEGPDTVAGIGADAARRLHEWAGRLNDWIDSEDPDATIRDQLRFGRQDEAETSQSVEAFSAACRRVIHPEDPADRVLDRRRLALPWR